MSTTGLYLPRDSPLHRTRAGAKLAALAAAIGVVVTLDSLRGLAAAAIGTVGLYAVARVPLRVGVAALRPMLWFVLALIVVQLLIADPRRAADVVGTLLISVALAALVTLTTRVTDMLDAVGFALGPLRRFGVDPDRVALVLALTIRGVPVIAGIVRTVREAQQARGMVGNPILGMVPVVVGILRHADALGEALAARGVDDA